MSKFNELMGLTVEPGNGICGIDLQRGIVVTRQPQSIENIRQIVNTLMGGTNHGVRIIDTTEADPPGRRQGVFNPTLEGE